jgi:hypothetical protein
MTMPLGNAIAPATCVATPSGVINAMTPTVDSAAFCTRWPISAKSKPMLLT